jgi:hypothetical protein
MQSRDGVADGRKHPLHLVLAALVDGKLDAPGPEAARVRWARRPVVQLDALA